MPQGMQIAGDRIVDSEGRGVSLLGYALAERSRRESLIVAESIDPQLLALIENQMPISEILAYAGKIDKMLAPNLSSQQRTDMGSTVMRDMTDEAITNGIQQVKNEQGGTDPKTLERGGRVAEASIRGLLDGLMGHVITDSTDIFVDKMQRDIRAIQRVAHETNADPASVLLDEGLYAHAMKGEYRPHEIAEPYLEGAQRVTLPNIMQTSLEQRGQMRTALIAEQLGAALEAKRITEEQVQKIYDQEIGSLEAELKEMARSPMFLKASKTKVDMLRDVFARVAVGQVERFYGEEGVHNLPPEMVEEMKEMLQEPSEMRRKQ